MKPTLVLAIFLALIVIAQTSPVNFNKRQESTSEKGSQIPPEANSITIDRIDVAPAESTSSLGLEILYSTTIFFSFFTDHAELFLEGNGLGHLI
ncbi:hypothetical protein C1645_821252 [Glomus cerebriforme]|uniref:Uncharacterized protein n=1 Tax=Glomus cerebriforme TaxID=658196 RepID=A0A397T516_9GLOM|nr:hypothetical protein C1645_821252 [Glomus cerebriforme]